MYYGQGNEPCIEDDSGCADERLLCDCSIVCVIPVKGVRCLDDIGFGFDLASKLLNVEIRF